MITLSDFKQILGEKSSQMNDDQLEVMRDLMETMADKILDDWLSEKQKLNKYIPMPINDVQYIQHEK